MQRLGIAARLALKYAGVDTLPSEITTKLRDQPRFPYPRVAVKEDELATAVTRTRPAPHAQIKLVIATDQRGRHAPMGREAIGVLPTGHRPPQLDRLAEPLQLPDPDLLELERAAGQPVGGFRHRDAVRLRLGLNAGGQRRRDSDDFGVAGKRRIRRISDDDQPGGDADPDLQARAELLCPPQAPLDQFERRRNSALGGILTWLGEPEIGAAAVALNPFEVPVVAADDGGRLVVERPLHDPELFGIELMQQGGRANDIVKERCYLPALSGKRGGSHLPSRHRTLANL